MIWTLTVPSLSDSGILFGRFLKALFGREDTEQGRSKSGERRPESLCVWILGLEDALLGRILNAHPNNDRERVPNHDACGPGLGSESKSA